MEQAKRSGNPILKLIFAGPLRVIVSFIVPVVAFLLLRWSFVFLRDSDASKLAIAVVAIIVGVFGVWILFFLTDNMVSYLPASIREGIRPFVFVGPALVILSIYLVYPVAYTFYISFLGRKSIEFVGLDNYINIVTSPTMLVTLRNSLLWMVIVTGFAVTLGLLIAVMVDRIGKWEPLAKSLIFMPMAISAVGASVIWKFMYTRVPSNRPQIGLINALIKLAGGEPIDFMITKPLNNYALMVIMIWLLTGFALVIISAAVKGVPHDLLEAGRIDGATEVRIFFGIIIPYIKGTLLTVTTTILIMVLKVFDIVYVMTGGRRDTQVVAFQMFDEFFQNGNFGMGSALAIVLLIAVIPIIISNVRSVREGRS